jgi:proliferating cell nuclear antigen PCNA
MPHKRKVISTGHTTGHTTESTEESPAAVESVKKPKAAAAAAAADAAAGPDVDSVKKVSSVVAAAAGGPDILEGGPLIPRPSEVDDTDFGSVDDLPPNTIVCMRTSQTQQWRTLSDFLKDMVTECNISFGPDGMRLHSLDPVKVALVHLHARSEFYVCRRAIVIGMNMTALYRMLRNLSTGGYMLEFSITSDEPDYFNIVLTNNEKRTTTRNKLKLMRLPDETISIPRANFERVLSIPSADFQRYIRELSSISNQISIKSTADQLILSASGPMGTSEIIIRPTASGMHWINVNGGDAHEHEVVEGVFMSKYLEKFSR